MILKTKINIQTKQMKRCSHGLALNFKIILTNKTNLKDEQIDLYSFSKLLLFSRACTSKAANSQFDKLFILSI
jgi:hypothetical protein